MIISVLLVPAVGLPQCRNRLAKRVNHRAEYFLEQSQIRLSTKHFLKA